MRAATTSLRLLATRNKYRILLAPVTQAVGPNHVLVFS